MSVLPTTHTNPFPKRQPVPPLENGDRLTRAEFERRYEAMPQVKKAELIEGIVHMPSPVRSTRHGRPHSILNGWLTYYISRTSGLHEFADNATVRLDLDNEPQPDIYLNLPKRLGGQAEIDQDDYMSGPPTLVCEIAASSVSIDLHRKLVVYRRNGVREYLVWRVDDQAVDWFALREGEYHPLPAEDRGVVRSEQFPGLWLSTPALIAGDLPALFKTVDEGTATAEHARFLERLGGVQ